MAKDTYGSDLERLQIELVKLQRHVIAHNDKILIVVEGRDAAGKDGLIKRFVEHLSPRETRVVALGKPSDRERTAWYFQRYVPHLPVADELVLFNRSWYNRAGVERVMGFCTDDEYEEFMHSVGIFELMLVRSGVKLFKYYLDISRGEEKKRLKERKSDPLTQWKTSPLDNQALKKWKPYTVARDEMLARTHTEHAPWTIARADDKHSTRLNVIRDALSRLDYKGKDKKLARPDPAVVFRYDTSLRQKGLLAK